MSKNNAQLIHQDSGNTEHYTPKEIIEAARLVMGGIDLDPASSAKANETVLATRYYTKEDDGLKQAWFGRVWMNHPYHDPEEPCKRKCKKKCCQDRGYCITERLPGNEDWINKMVSEYKAGNVTEACMICFASTSEAWFEPLLAYPQAYIKTRVKHVKDGATIGKSPTKGSVITYFGSHVDRFYQFFNGSIQNSIYTGHVMLPYAYSLPGTHHCAVCEKPFLPKRADALYCSPACNQKAKRDRAKE